MLKPFAPYKSATGDGAPEMKMRPGEIALPGLISLAGRKFEKKIFRPYCSVTRTWITPFPLFSGSRALPTTAPNMRLRFLPFMA